MKVCIVGCGAIAGTHAKVLRELGHQIVGFCDIERSKAETLAGQFGEGAAVFANTEACLVYDWGDLDGVLVATPACAHAEVVKQALGRGHNVLVEKPMALYPHEALRMVETAKMHGRKLMVAESMAYSQPMREMKQVIEKERLGPRPYVWRVMGGAMFQPQAWIKDEKIGGGTFIEGGIHFTHLAQWFFGKAVKWNGQMFRWLGGDAFDSGTALITYEQGDQMLFHAIWGCPVYWDAALQEKFPAPIRGQDLLGPQGVYRLQAQPDQFEKFREEWRVFERLIQGDDSGVAITPEMAAGALEDMWKCIEDAKGSHGNT